MNGRRLYDSIAWSGKKWYLKKNNIKIHTNARSANKSMSVNNELVKNFTDNNNKKK